MPLNFIFVLEIYSIASVQSVLSVILVRGASFTLDVVDSGCTRSVRATFTS